MKIGLVLAGGGAKGAYQMGVWKALRTFGVEPYITAVSGTSIGAMNAYLFARGDMDLGYNLWQGVKKEDILHFNAAEVAENFVKMQKELPSLREKNFPVAYQLALFDRDRLSAMLASVVSDPALKPSAMGCYATSYCGERAERAVFKLNGLSKTQAVTVLNATSAIPGAFTSVEIGGYHFYDGGMAENVPVTALYEQGYRSFIVVYLAQRDFIDKSAFPGARFLEIVPSKTLGDFFTGTLNFNQDTIRGHIEQGYNDTKAILLPYKNTMELFEDGEEKQLDDTEPALKKLTKRFIYDTFKELIKAPEDGK